MKAKNCLSQNSHEHDDLTDCKHRSHDQEKLFRDRSKTREHSDQSGHKLNDGDKLLRDFFAVRSNVSREAAENTFGCTCDLIA